MIFQLMEPCRFCRGSGQAQYGIRGFSGGTVGPCPCCQGYSFEMGYKCPTCGKFTSAYASWELHANMSAWCWHCLDGQL